MRFLWQGQGRQPQIVPVTCLIRLDIVVMLADLGCLLYCHPPVADVSRRVRPSSMACWKKLPQTAKTFATDPWDSR